MRKNLSRFWKDDTGATAIEYGLIIALISLAIVGGIGTVGNNINYLWGNNNSRLAVGLNAH